MALKAPEERYRNWATVVYLESAPENWRSILDDHHVESFISPYHDRDINPTGEPKKPHYHVMVMYEGKKSRAQVQALFQQIGGVGCECIGSIRGYARYLCHLDNPDKAQYKIEEVHELSGADYNAIIGLPVDRIKLLREISQFIDDNGITKYSDLVKIARDGETTWFRVICDNTFFFREYIKSIVSK